MRQGVRSLLVGLALLSGSALATAVPAQAASPLPSDPSARGYIGLCDESGQNVSGGSVDSVPFVWKAVASQPPPSQFAGAGQNTALTIYQPRPQIPPSSWSGTTMTAASYYTQASHPAAQATYRDVSLRTIIADYPPKDDGLYVLRMSFGKRNYGLYNSTYPTTTIQVVGARWRVIAGGTVDCHKATAVSNEQLTGVVSKQDSTPRVPASSGRSTTGGGTDKAGSTTGSTSPTSNGSNGSTSASVAPRSGTGVYSQSPVALDASGKPIHNGTSLAWLWLLALVVPLAAVGVVFWRRRSTA